MDQLIIKKHQQLENIKDRLFSTFLARDVEFYEPEFKENGHVLLDEFDFEEAETAGTVHAERLPISYIYQKTIKAIEVEPAIDGQTTIVRNNEINEFDPDKTYHFLVQTTDMPLRSVIQYEIPISLEDNSSQTVTLIKVNELSNGKPPFVDKIHVFTAFDRELK